MEDKSKKHSAIDKYDKYNEFNEEIKFTKKSETKDRRKYSDIKVSSKEY